MAKVLKPEDFVLCNGTEAGIPGLQVVTRLGDVGLGDGGNDPSKCKITVDEAGRLHIKRQDGNVGLICAPEFWAYAKKPA